MTSKWTIRAVTAINEPLAYGPFAANAVVSAGNGDTPDWDAALGDDADEWLQRGDTFTARHIHPAHNPVTRIYTECEHCVFGETEQPTEPNGDNVDWSTCDECRGDYQEWTDK